MKLKKVYSAMLTVILTCSLAVTPVFATPESGDTASLEEQKAAKSSEVKSLQNELNSVISKMNELETQLIEKGQQIVQAEEDLKAAKKKEKQQYEDLKLRIKYMYEEGDSSALERIFTSGSIADVLAQAEYVQAVHTYDRKQLEVYQETVQEVKDLKTTLVEDQERLQSLEGEYKEQSAALTSTIESKSAEISDLDAMIQEAARKAAEEAARKAAEEEANNGGGGTPGGGGGGYVPPSNNVTTPPDDGTIVGRAYSYLGKADYVWGACRPGAFDCSGFVAYCLTGRYQRLGNTITFLGWPRVGNPQPGDVAVNEGHCGIYVGGGMMVHAASPSEGVIEGPVQEGMVFVRY